MSSLREWLRALAIAIGVLLFVHFFLYRVVAVRNVSMYATLLPGDRVLVQRWAAWSGVGRGDIVVFRDPMKDHVAKYRRPLLVKRVIGMPGDTVEVRDGIPWVNGQEQPWPGTATQAYLVRLAQDAAPGPTLQWTGLPHLVRPDRRVIELPLNAALADRLEANADVISVGPMRSATGAPLHLFPFTRRYRWNTDNYGPIIIPAKGDTLRIDIDNMPLYDRLISRYEGHRLSNSGDTLLIEGGPLKTYVVKKDYYFVLGDSRHHSADSRHWGFLPGDHIVGRVSLILFNNGPGELRTGGLPHRP